MRTVAQGRPFFSPAISQALLEDYLRSLRQRGLQDSYDLLTQREKEILQLLAEGNNTKQVADKLQVSIKTVETHRQHIMNKLDIFNIAELTKYAIREGLTSLNV